MNDPDIFQPIPASEDEQCKYWAFLSYSHQDKIWANWLHKRLETYRVPRRMVGCETRNGRIPKRLFPVFRDVEELPTSASLGEAITTALRQSRCLIVICSPQSAKSIWVNEEVLAFKRMGRSDRLLCLIVAGEPNAADKPQLGIEECFPPAVRFHIDPNGQLSSRRTEPIAADLRPGSSLKNDAKLKIIAGILGVGFDELKHRDLRRRRLRGLWFAVIALVVLSLVCWWIVHAKRQADHLQQKADAVHELENKIQNLPFPRMSGKYTPGEIESLKSRRKILDNIQKYTHERYTAGVTPRGDYLKATYEICFADAELAWADGDLKLALYKLAEAGENARQYLEIAVAQYGAGVTPYENVAAGEKILAEVNLAIERMRQVLDLVKGPLSTGDLPDATEPPAVPPAPPEQSAENELPEPTAPLPPELPPMPNSSEMFPPPPPHNPDK